MGDWDVRFRSDGTVMVAGVDTGALTVVKWEPGKVLVLHEAARKRKVPLPGRRPGWPFKWTPARFRVLVPAPGDRWRHLAEFPARWREATP